MSLFFFNEFLVAIHIVSDRVDPALEDFGATQSQAWLRNALSSVGWKANNNKVKTTLYSTLAGYNCLNKLNREDRLNLATGSRKSIQPLTDIVTWILQQPGRPVYRTAASHNSTETVVSHAKLVSLICRSRSSSSQFNGYTSDLIIVWIWQVWDWRRVYDVPNNCFRMFIIVGCTDAVVFLHFNCYTLHSCDWE